MDSKTVRLRVGRRADSKDLISVELRRRARGPLAQTEWEWVFVAGWNDPFPPKRRVERTATALNRQSNSVLIRGSLRFSRRSFRPEHPAGPILLWLRAAVPIIEE